MLFTIPAKQKYEYRLERKRLDKNFTFSEWRTAQASRAALENLQGKCNDVPGLKVLNGAYVA